MKDITWILTVLTMLRMETKSSEPDVCFNWTVSSGMKLTLVCRIQKYKFATSIVDPKGDVKANCFPLASSCFTNQNNGNVSFNRKTNELTFTVCGDVNKGVNGNWTCKHGSDKAIAHVKVTVLACHDISNQSQVKTQQTLFGSQCIEVIICLASISFLSAIIITLLIMTFFSRIQGIIHEIKKGAFALLTLLFFCFAVFIGWQDSDDCETKWFFIGFGVVFGCIFSLTCLSREVSQEAEGSSQQSLNVLFQAEDGNGPPERPGISQNNEDGNGPPERPGISQNNVSQEAEGSSQQSLNVLFQAEENSNSLEEQSPCVSANEDKHITVPMKVYNDDTSATIDEEESFL